MKLTTRRMVGWQASSLRSFVVILGYVVAAAIVTGQEIRPVNEDSKPAETPVVPATAAPAKRVADPKMPDVSGNWEMGKDFEFGEAVIRRIEHASDDFAIQYRAAKEGRDQRIKWFPEAQRFEVTNIELPPNRSARITLQLLANGKSLRVVFEVDEQSKEELRKNPNLSESQKKEFLNQEWTRTKKPVGKVAKFGELTTDPDQPTTTNRDADSKMPDISGKWTYTPTNLPPEDDVTGASPATCVVRRSTQAGIDFEFWGTHGPFAAPLQLKWEPGTRRFRKVPLNDTVKEEATFELSTDGNQLSQRFQMVGVNAMKGGSGKVEVIKLTQEWRRGGTDKVAVPTPLKEPASTPTSDKDSTAKIPDIVGTWSRAESGTFSKLTIRPVENSEFLFFVEGADGNGLLKSLPTPSQPTPSHFLGAFTFNVLGDRSTEVLLAMGPKDATRLTLNPADELRKHLLRSGFAKTERELDKKLESDWTRAEAPVEPIPAPTVAVVKTQFDPSRIRESLRAKYREPPYRFFSNDTYSSVIVVAPVEAQEDLEALIHQLDVPEKPNQQVGLEKNGDSYLVTETKDGLAFFSRTQAKWTNLKLPDPKDGRTLLGHVVAGQHIAVFHHDDVVYAFIGPTGRLAKLAVPAGFRGPIFNPVVANESATVQLGDEVFAISVSSEEWRSPNSAASVRNAGGQSSPDQVLTSPTRALPDTPAAKLLVEQLGAQESAAAAEAATIRPLPANGQAEQNRQPLAEHQRKLKNLLSTAFDLKLQLEELQVKELQSRLSRLERQIGQRKELREKIINRRATELIEGETLKWDSMGANAETNNVTASTLKAAARDSQAIEPSVMIAKQSASSQPSYQEFAKKLGTMNSWVAEREEALSQAEREAGNDIVIDTVPRARRHLEEALRNRKAIQDEYAAILRDLELQIESAKVEADATKQETVRIQRAVEQGAVPIKQQSEIQLRLKHATLTLERLKVRYDLYKKAGEGVAASDSSVGSGNSDAAKSLPSPEELQAQLEPFAKRVTAAAESVRKLEVTYLLDRSNTAELKLALKELGQARSEWRNRLKAIEPSLNLISINLQSAEILGDSLGQRMEAITKQLADGKTTEADLNAAAEAWKRAAESTVAAKSKAEQYAAAITMFGDVAADDKESFTLLGPAQTARPQPGYEPDIALAWLEAATGLKLEFVRLDDLQLWFKAALRVRESGSRYKAGDLIVTLNNHLFESLDQAVDALSEKSRASFDDIVLPGGLAGHRQQAHFSGEDVSRYLKPGHPDKDTYSDEATIRFEVRVRGEAANELVTLYLLGTCVSPEGLVAIPVSSKSLAVDEPLVAYGTIKGTARVVATDDAHGLTLVKLESPDQPLFSWLKCRSGSPATGQQLTVCDAAGQYRDVAAVEVGQPLPKPLVGNDAFVVETSTAWVVPLGTVLMSVENELQGITIASEPSPVKRDLPDNQTLNRHIAIPAVHIEKLVKDYRKTAARQAQKHAALEVPAANVSIGPEAAAKLIWDKIGMKFGGH